MTPTGDHHCSGDTSEYDTATYNACQNTHPPISMDVDFCTRASITEALASYPLAISNHDLLWNPARAVKRGMLNVASVR